MIWNFCIRRPVLTVVVFIGVGIFGVYGYFNMPVREFPDIEYPIVSVNVVLPGAEPEVIESQIIEPLEEEINTVEGLKTLTSTAREQVGTVIAEFELWRDIDVAAQDVRDRVNRSLRELPDGIESPIVRKLDPDARAIMWIALRGDDRWDEVQLSRYADEVIKPRLENLRGAGRVQIGGERRYAARVSLDPERLAAHDLTVQEVVAIIQRNNVDIPSGRIESRAREFLVKTQGQFASHEPIGDLIVAYRNDAPVRVMDVGTVRAGVEDDRQVARFKGEVTVGLGVVKQSGANTVALAERVRERMRAVSRDFPPGLIYTVASDDSEFVEASINDLVITIAIATALVVLVVLGFLHSIAGTLITALAIPTSLFGGVAVMHLLGFSVNTLTMLALILAIGIVIDDTIVVLESSYRHLERGTDPIPAARVGTTEVAFAAIANTLSLCAVFIPVAFTSGLIGRFFYEFGLGVAITVIFSTLTALSLTAMLASRFLRSIERKRAVFRWFDAAFEGLENVYKRLLGASFDHRVLTILLGAAALAVGAWCFSQLPREFSPVADRAQFIISFETPEGATLSQTDVFARRMERVLERTPQVEHQFLAVGLSRGGGPGKVNEGIVFVSLLPRNQREKHQSRVAQEVRERLSGIPGGRAYVVETSVGAIQAGAPIQLKLMHTDIEALSRRQETLMAWMRKQKLFTGVRSDLKMNKPQVEVRILRDRASQMGVSVEAVSNTMRLLLGEPDVSEIERESERYEVITEVSNKGRMVPRDLERLYVRSATGELVSLDNLIEMEESVGPSAISHHNRMRAATLSSSLVPGVALGEGLEALTAYLDRSLPGGFSYEFAGETQDFQESFRNLTVTIAFSVAFIYLILAAQFESFLHPLTMLLTLPLAMVGAFGALWAFDMPFGIVSFIGLIMLTGMATKNAILMIDYTNVLIARGEKAKEAAGKAARVRFRPVIMTTISTVLGILPIALGYGAGGEARAPMGVAVSAGLLATTGLTLLILPVVFTLVHGFREALFGARERAGYKEAS
ncbi:MAG: efflux RND transporter permease subunit [Deltaproteobacteria bacterium]|nr:efflux RND transporter permease subunit [Deltaproteobacteria bacterium]